MCLYCHLGLGDKTAIEELRKTLEDPRFSEWNTTSLSHVLLSIRGLDGSEGHSVGVEVAEKFYSWFLGWSGGYWEMLGAYLPASGLEPFPSSSRIREMIDEAVAFYREHQGKSREELVKLMTNGQGIAEVRREIDGGDSDSMEGVVMEVGGGD